jgi:hypothetical protein
VVAIRCDQGHLIAGTKVPNRPSAHARRPREPNG